MKEDTLTVPQRKVLSDMLRTNHWDDCLWKTAKDKYDDARNSMRLAFAREASIEVKDLIEELAAVRKESKDLEAKQENIETRLSKRGLSVDSDGDVSIERSSPLYQSVEKRIDDELGTLNEVVNLPFERARIRLWTVATPEETEKLIEPFLHFEIRKAK